MKKIIYLLTFIPVLAIAQGRVGIKTENPTQTLDVNGDVLIETTLVETTNRDISGPFLLYARSKDTTPVGEIKMLDPSLMNVAPVNVYKVTVSNVNQDRITNINTGLQANKYFLAITDVRFLGANAGSNAITVGGIAEREYGTFSNGISVNGSGNYVLSLDFVGAGTQGATNGNWEFTLLVYHISMLTDFGTVTTTVSGNSGTAPTGTAVDKFN